MSENNIKNTVESLISGMDGLISSKTVVGDAIQVKERRSFLLWTYLLGSEPVLRLETEEEKDRAIKRQRAWAV